MSMLNDIRDPPVSWRTLLPLLRRSASCRTEARSWLIRCVRVESLGPHFNHEAPPEEHGAQQNIRTCRAHRRPVALMPSRCTAPGPASSRCARWAG
jgi:hypothetical protein